MRKESTERISPDQLPPLLGASIRDVRLREVVEQVLDFGFTVVSAGIHMQMYVSGTLRIDTFNTTMVRRRSLRQIPVTDMDWNPILMLIELRINVVAWLVGVGPGVSCVDFVNVHPAGCAGPIAGWMIDHFASSQRNALQPQFPPRPNLESNVAGGLNSRT